MPADYVNLPWLTQPDPVQSYAHGLQIGTQIGTEQARQQLAQQQMLQQQQESQIRQAHADAVFQLESQAQARKFAAQQQYQNMVQGGMDPAQALLKVGPSLGQSVEGLAMQQQITPYQQAELNQRSDISSANIDLRKQQIEATADAKKASLEATQAWRQFQEDLKRKQLEDKESQLDPVDKAQLAETVKELALVNKKINETPEQKPGFFGGGNLDDIKALKAKAQELTDRINSFRKGKKTSTSRFKYDRGTGKIVPVEDTQDTPDDSETDN